jgi:hypothetical protein
MITRRGFGTRLALAGAAVLAPSVVRAAESPAERAARTQRHNDEVLGALFDVDVPVYAWERIVVHHTATKAASLAGIDRYHRNHFGDPLGAEYHFVINNGRKLPMGWMEVARWRYQEPAWHLFHPERAPAAIAICLVGNFENTELAAGQLDALVDLSAALMRGLNIDVEHVTTHRGVDGRLTQCPGKHFPRERYLDRLRERVAAATSRIVEDPAQATPVAAKPTIRCLW